MHMRLFSHDLQFLNLGDRVCNLKKVWWDTVGIGEYALSNALRFVQWPRYTKNYRQMCVFEGQFWTVENDAKMVGKRQLFRLDTALVLTP